MVKGQPEADAGLRDNENVPLGESVYDYFEREVKPHVPDAWIDESKTDAQDGEVGVVGFEIPSTATSMCSSLHARWRRSTAT